MSYLMPAFLFALSFGIGGIAEVCPDADLDLYHDCTVSGCDPTGLTCGDCDDGDDQIHPGATEVCNHRDDDCDGGVDEGFTSVTASERCQDEVLDHNDNFGEAVASIGDVDGDEIPDFVVGARNRDPLGAGGVTVFSGAGRGILCRHRVDGESYAGQAVAAVGDLDGDFVPDYAVGTGFNVIALFSGADCGEIARCTDPNPLSAALGTQHGLAGWVDVTGDGVPEILAGGYTSRVRQHHGGQAVVFSYSRSSGQCTILHDLVDAELNTSWHLGYAVAGIEDVTGDAVPDIVVGEPGYSEVGIPNRDSLGAVLVFSGADGAFVRRLLHPASGRRDRFGEDVDSIEDVDGDDVADIVVGKPSVYNPGEVLFYSGADGSWIRSALPLDGDPSDRLGRSLAILPDVDGDGIEDVVAGAWADDNGSGYDAGRAVVFSGADGSMIRSLEDPSGFTNDQLGYDVAAAGDLSGDGIAEIIVGGWKIDIDPFVDMGCALLFSLETDCDGDSYGPFGGDCDDTDANVWRVPSETRALIFSSKSAFSWLAPEEPGHASGTLYYDTLRSESADDFDGASCLETDDTDLSAADGSEPSPGAGYYYLTRAQNDCGNGDAGTSDATDAPRQARGCP